MPIATRNPAPTVVRDTVELPPTFPELPDDVLKRFPSLGDWEEDTTYWWNKTSAAIQDNNQTISQSVSTTNSNIINLRVSINGATAAITEERIARITADGILAQRIVTVSAIAGVSSNIKVQATAPVGPAVNDFWVNNADPLNPVTYKWTGVEWDEVTEPISVAAVAAEQTARITADGYLSGKYTLTVIAGNVVTGMNITSSSGAGTNISSVIFRATDFQIYNGVTGVTMFAVSGATVNLAGTLTVSTSGKVFIGTGTYGNTNTAWYVDSTGQFSLKDKLTWDGTTLGVNGTLVSASGYFGSSSNAVSITSAGLNVGTTGSISGGQTAYATGAGFWLGYTGGAYKFSLGDGTNNNLFWTGTALQLQMTGTMITTSTILNTNNASYTTWQGDAGINDSGFYLQRAGTSGGGVATLGIGTSIPLFYMARGGGAFGAVTNLSANSICSNMGTSAYIGSAWNVVTRLLSGIITASATTPYYLIETGNNGIANSYRFVFNFDGKMYFGVANDVTSPNTLYASPYMQDPLANLYRSSTGVIATDGALAVLGKAGLGGTSMNSQVQITGAISANNFDLIVNRLRGSTNHTGILFRNDFWTNNASAGMAAIYAKDTTSSGGELHFQVTANGGGAGGAPLDAVVINNGGDVTFSSYIRCAAGSASLPGVSFSADTSSGMYLVGASDLDFSVGGTRYFGLHSSKVVCYFTLQLADTYSAGVTTATGTIKVKDSTGTDYNVLVHT